MNVGSQAAPAELIVCETCGSTERETHGSTRGERLVQLLRSRLGERASIAISTTRCLWSCSRSCAVHVRSKGRYAYVLGTLEPSEEHADALLDYASLYVSDEAGVVPFKRWPQALRGHFICRLPPSHDDEGHNP